MMTQVLPIRRTFKYRLYQCQKKDKLLYDALNIAGIIWNHCLALQKRYFRLCGKPLSEARLKKHISKLRMRSQKYAYWKKLGSQAVQEVIERLEKAYQRFFQKQGGLPRFKKVKQYNEAPEYLKLNLKQIRTLNRAVSRKQKGSRNRQKAKQQLSRSHLRIADKRRDYHFKLAHELCAKYDILVFEDLNIAAMKRLWGRKISDLGFSQFLDIVEWVGLKQGKIVLKLERFTPTTQLCSVCGHRQKLSLSERVFSCSSCALVLDRDHNAAINIQQAGASASTKRDLVRPLS